MNKDKTAYLGLGGQLSNWRDVAMTNPSGEFRIIVRTGAFMKQNVNPPDVVCVAGTRLAIRACDMASWLFDSGSRRSQGRVYTGPRVMVVRSPKTSNCFTLMSLTAGCSPSPAAIGPWRKACADDASANR